MSDQTQRVPDGAPVTTPPVLDSAHIGDIKGAFGTIGQHELGRSGLRGRLLAALAVLGPGIIVMVGDNDAGGVATYSQAGQNYGTSLLWVLVLLVPVLIVNQEMVIRLGAVTGVGHGKLIFERFGKFWGAFSVFDLFILNFLTIVTEFIGVDLALGYFGVSRYVSVPVAAILLVAVTASGSFRRWERFMFLFVFANLLVIPLLILSHPSGGAVVHHTLVPSIAGGANSTSVLLIIAIVGTTVAPWQLFFQQSNIIDKRITTRWINYERLDTVLGSFITVLGAGALIAICAAAFGGTPLEGHFTDAGGVAAGLRTYVGSGAGAMYAIILLNASLIGAAAVTLATSYAVGDTFGIRHSLHRGMREAKGFYASFVGMVALAAVIVLIPGAPLGVITTSVQALAGVLLPSASVFLLILCNDRDVLGPWVNRAWLNALAIFILGVLLMLSSILIVTTLFPSVDVPRLALELAIVLGIGLIGFAIAIVVSQRRLEAAAPRGPQPPRESWTMPQATLLTRPTLTLPVRMAMWVLRSYLVVAVLLLIIKAVELAN
jgi:Mn2+/Fe2+ NRAMP family transporter